MSLLALSAKTRPLVQRAVQSQGIRAMTVLSKQSGEEYKKMVGFAVDSYIVFACYFSSLTTYDFFL
jgi:hypothetical protein